MVSQAELRKRRVKANKEQQRQEQVVQVAQTKARRRRQWMVIGLAVVLILPLVGAGLIVFLDNGDEATSTATNDLPLTTIPALVDPGFEGGSISGDTPCPATDGSQERITSFTSAPSGCLTDGASYSVDIDSLTGTTTIELDAATSPEATDLFVSLARFGVYEGARFTFFENGLAVIGGFGDAGFSVPAAAAEAPTDGYPVGSVVLLTELGSGLLAGQVVIVLDEAGGDELAADNTSPIIGTVTGGIDAIEELLQLQIDSADSVYRVRSADVTESAG